MISSIVLLLTVIKLCVSQFAQPNVFYWKDCGDPTTRSAFTEDFQLLPDPLRFGQDAHYNASFLVVRDLPDDAVIGIELWRSLNVLGLYPLDVQVPCMFGGECKVNLRHLIGAWRLACDFVRANRDGDCDGPIVAQRYIHSGKAYIPGTNHVVAAVAQGVYKARVKVVDGKSNELACVSFIGGIFTQELAEQGWQKFTVFYPETVN